MKVRSKDRLISKHYSLHPTELNYLVYFFSFSLEFSDCSTSASEMSDSPAASAVILDDEVPSQSSKRLRIEEQSVAVSAKQVSVSCGVFKCFHFQSLER